MALSQLRRRQIPSGALSSLALLRTANVRPPGRADGRVCRRRLGLLVAVLLLVNLLITVGAAAPPAEAVSAQDWPTFLQNAGRTAAVTDPTLSPANAANLKLKWRFKTGAPIATSASVVGTTAYFGSWDGYEYAVSTTSGALVWKAYLGLTQDPGCQPPTIGITSAAAVINGRVYVGGGDAYWYALDATTGAVLWKVFTGDNSQAGAHYNWSSPLIANGAAYIGIASNCDNPLVPGHLLKVDLTSHAVVADYSFVPPGQVGAGIWTSPTLDAASNTVFVSTGTINDYTQTQSQAIVALDANQLTYRSSWQLPFEASVQDSDWGTTPTLVSDAAGDKLLSVANKNGVVYTFNRSNLAAGPVWQRSIAIGGDCPTCGDGTIASGAFVNNVLYYAGGNNLLNGRGSGGSVTALDPATGRVLWTHQTEGPVIGAPAVVNGVIGLVAGSSFQAIDAANGTLIYSYPMAGPGYGAVSFGRTQFYAGDYDTNLYAFGLAAITKPPADPNCPAGLTCQDIRNPAIAGSETSNGTALTVTASGAAIHGTSDQFRYLWKSVTGDTQATVTVTDQSTQNQQPQAGLMLRQSADPTSPFFAALAYPNDLTEGLPAPDVVLWYRQCWGCNSVELTKWYPANRPVSLVLQRAGNLFSAGISFDATHYQLIPGGSVDLELPVTLMSGLAVDSGSTSNTGTATFTNLALGATPSTILSIQPPADPCPAAWTCEDIGNPNPVGDTTVANGSYTLYGTGAGIGGRTDSFHYVFSPVTGDHAISARVTTQTTAPKTAQDGLMMRANDSPSSPFYGVFLNPTGSATIAWRAYDGVAQRKGIPLPTVTSPAWITLVRYTDTSTASPLTTFSALTSTDGSNWTPVLGSTVAITMGSGSYLVGMAASAAAPRVSPPTVISNVDITAGPARPPGICPTGLSCADIGVNGLPGNQLYLDGTWTMQGRGSDIWATYDSFRFGYQSFPADPANSSNGDGTVSTRVISQAGGGEWMKSGVMIRSGTDPQAAYYGVFLTPLHGIVVQWRSQQAAATSSVGTSGATGSWLLAARYTDAAHGLVYYSASVSTDGQHFTTIPGSVVALKLPGPLVAGLVSDSYNSAAVATATMDNLAQLPGSQAPPGICPAAWTCTDIGGPVPGGQDDLTPSGTWTVSAGGGDIWDTADSMHLVNQTLTGDGTLTARMASQQAPDPWAKAGPMLRADLSPGAAYYAAFVTPSNGIAVQWRGTANGATAQVVTAGSAPVWLRISRYTIAGSNPQTLYTTYTSSDGSTWTAVPGSTVPLNLPSTTPAGVAVTSHDQGAAATVGFDQVAVSTTAIPTTGLCPVGWTCSDIGAPLPAGQDDLAADGTWTVSAGGGDIWDTADSMHLVNQTLTGDGTVAVRLQSQGATDPWAKAGPMLRAGVAPGAPYYAVFVTPGHGLAVQWRAAQDATTSQLVSPGTTPVWLQIARFTDSNAQTEYTAYSSADGQTWTAVAGSTVALTLPTTALAGFAVTSHNQGVASTVVLDHVLIGNSAPPPPS